LAHRRTKPKALKLLVFRCEVRWKGINKLVCGRIVALLALNFLIAVGGWLTDGQQLAVLGVQSWLDCALRILSAKTFANFINKV